MIPTPQELREAPEWEWLRQQARVIAASKGVAYEEQLSAEISGCIYGRQQHLIGDELPQEVRQAMLETDTNFLPSSAVEALQRGESPAQVAHTIRAKGMPPLRAARQIAADKAFMRRAAGR